MLVIAPLALAAGLLSAGLAASLRRGGIAVAYTRKTFHFAIFTVAALVHGWQGAAGVVVFGCVVALLIVHATVRGKGNGLYDAIARPSDAPHERLFIVAPLVATAVGGVTSNLLFGPFASVGYLVAGWGDALAEPVGGRWGRHRYRVPSLFGVEATRSVQGSLAVLAAGALAAFVALLLDGCEPVAAAVTAVAVGSAAAFVEAVSTHGLDNLTVQLAASGVAFAMLRGAMEATVR